MTMWKKLELHLELQRLRALQPPSMSRDMKTGEDDVKTG